MSTHPLRCRRSRRESAHRVVSPPISTAAHGRHGPIFAGPMPRVERYDVAVPLAVRVAHRQYAGFELCCKRSCQRSGRGTGVMEGSCTPLVGRGPLRLRSLPEHLGSG
jgi:hypothetical protein